MAQMRAAAVKDFGQWAKATSVKKPIHISLAVRATVMITCKTYDQEAPR